jgi:hypothetical protein
MLCCRPLLPASQVIHAKEADQPNLGLSPSVGPTKHLSTMSFNTAGNHHRMSSDVTLPSVKQSDLGAALAVHGEENIVNPHTLCTIFHH